MTPVTYKYYLIFYFNEFEDIQHVNGTISGMDKSVNVITREASTETIKFSFDCEKETTCFSSIINTFGAKNSKNNDCFISLQVELNNAQLQFDYNITEQMRKQPFGGVIILKEIEIYPKKGENTWVIYPIVILAGSHLITFIITK